MKNNTPFKLTLLAIALLASSASPQAFAVDDMDDAAADQTAYAASFNTLDVDGSKSLTKSEVKDDKLFSKHFATADKNNDGSLDQEEYINYKSKSGQKGVKRIVKDSVITSKVKGNLLKDEGLKSLKVSVKTNQGVVMLSGFVETENQIQEAERIAAETEGVKSVKNSLVLKKD